jgi:hypothetical protein
MSTKLLFPCALVLAVLGVRAVWAQDYRTPTGDFPPPPAGQLDAAHVPAPTAEESVPPLQNPGPSLSRWLVYQTPDCCGKVGCDGPIFAELYLGTGVEIPASGKIFGQVLETGWLVQGGGRSVLFNPAMDRDWNIDLSVSNILNHGQHSDIKIPISLPTMPVTAGNVTFATQNVSVRELNRTYVNASVGREWYFQRPPDALIHTWRFGVNAGGRLGSEKVELYEVTHLTDVIGGVFVGLNADVQIPCGGCCVFLAGMRVEWGYTWSDIFKPNDSDIQDVNFLFTAEVRF